MYKFYIAEITKNEGEEDGPKLIRAFADNKIFQISKIKAI